MEKENIGLDKKCISTDLARNVETVILMQRYKEETYL